MNLQDHFTQPYTSKAYTLPHQYLSQVILANSLITHNPMLHLNRQEILDAIHYKLSNTCGHCVYGIPSNPDHAICMTSQHGGRPNLKVYLNINIKYMSDI